MYLCIYTIVSVYLEPFSRLNRGDGLTFLFIRELSPFARENDYAFFIVEVLLLKGFWENFL